MLDKRLLQGIRDLGWRETRPVQSGVIPLALGGGKTGSEIQTPMAIVILCGLTTSTLLNMFVVPTLYLRYARPRQRAFEETEPVAIAQA